MWRDGEVAAAIAAEAGQRLMELRSAQPSGTASLGARGDAAAHSVLLACLRQLRGDDPVVSEEGDVANAPIARRFWLVDPLDGTREYAERDRSDWAIHVAVVTDGVVTAGAVALPRVGSCSRPSIRRQCRQYCRRRFASSSAARDHRPSRTHSRQLSAGRLFPWGPPGRKRPPSYSAK